MFASAFGGLLRNKNTKMENLFDFEGSSVDYRVFTTSAVLNDQLVTSLTSFVQLYSQNRDRVQRSSESFALMAARLHQTHEDLPETDRGLFTVFGGVLGAACGGVCGGVWGAFGAVSAATCARLCGEISAVGATVGFVGSVFGGIVGGALGGTIGAAVGAEATGGPVHAVVSNTAWFTIGFATGGAIGSVFGGTVGAAGGAVGGAFGALYGTRFSVRSVGSVAAQFCESEDSKKMKSKKVNVIQKAGEFRVAIKPLLDELKTIKAISNKMASSVFVHSVARQTAKTLASVNTMEETINDSQEATDLPQLVSSVEDAVRLSVRITEELETTRAEVEKLLVSLKKPEV